MSGAIAGTGIVWALRLGFSPSPLAASSAASLAVSTIIVSLIAVAGILVPRARWGRRLSFGVVALSGLLAVIFGPDAWTAVAVLPAAIALVALVGPWLDSWLRRFSSADGPPWRAIAVPVAGALTPAAVALAKPGGLGPAAIGYATAVVIVSWAYSRAQLWALWVLRLGLIPGAVAIALGGSTAGLIGLVAWSLGVSILAWSRDAAVAASPLMSMLPPARVGTARPVANDR